MHKLVHRLALTLMLVALVTPAPRAQESAPRARVIVSTDIGGTDFDDFQSMVHLFVYADSMDLEGILASPYGKGTKADILAVIAEYEKDYPNLKTYSDEYPTPDALRAISKQGAPDTLYHQDFSKPSEGSDWLVECARRDDPRPLLVLVWGGIDDLAQALHDAPEILPKLRVYYIGGPNKKWGSDAFQHIVDKHPKLWIIEANETYCGWFTGGDQSGSWGNKTFITDHVAGRGAMGDYFAKINPDMKMGDSPSVTWALYNDIENPGKSGWGGQFVRAWRRQHVKFDRLTTAEDKIEQFCVMDLVLPLGEGAPDKPEGAMQIENQKLPGKPDGPDAGGKRGMMFRFSPKAAKGYTYVIHSNAPALEGRAGAMTSLRPGPEMAAQPDPNLPNWWTDDPSPAAMEGDDVGAKTVSRWRLDFLKDFAERMERCKAPKGK